MLKLDIVLVCWALRASTHEADSITDVGKMTKPVRFIIQKGTFHRLRIRNCPSWGSWLSMIGGLVWFCNVFMCAFVAFCPYSWRSSSIGCSWSSSCSECRCWSRSTFRASASPHSDTIARLVGKAILPKSDEFVWCSGIPSADFWKKTFLHDLKKAWLRQCRRWGCVRACIQIVRYLFIIIRQKKWLLQPCLTHTT